MGIDSSSHDRFPVEDGSLPRPLVSLLAVHKQARTISKSEMNHEPRDFHRILNGLGSMMKFLRVWYFSTILGALESS
jgi:hypothetical protein